MANQVSESVGELEVAVTLASMAGDPGFKDLPNWQQAAVDSVKALGVPSAPYANHIMTFVEKFGGGDGAPMIKLMDSFNKQFSCNGSFGSSFWKALAEVEFADKTSLYPLTRVAIALANLTCPAAQKDRM